MLLQSGLIALMLTITNAAIYNTQLLYIDDTSQLQPLECTQYILKFSYKPASIQITNISGIDHIFYTDTPFTADSADDTPTIQQRCMNNQELFCGGGQAFPGESFQFLVSYCIDQFYIYVKPTAGATAQLTITSTYSNNTCTPIIADDDINEYVHCGSLSPSQCQVSCDEDCSYFACVDYYNQTLANLCLPDEVAPDEVSGRCQAVSGIATTAALNNYYAINDCSSQWANINFNQEDFDSPFFYVIMILIGLILISAIFYRYRLRKTGEVPFAVPGWCPNCLYPQSNQDRMGEEDSSLTN